jgi:hypothetical protein
MANEKKSIQELLAKSAKDPVFAQQLINNPAQFKEEYELSDEEMASISGAGQAAAKTGGAGAHPELYDNGGSAGVGVSGS